MKIHQLPMGARFEFAGVEYVKCGPLVAAGPQGQRLIPKYAVLKALDGQATTAPPREPLAREAVLAAFDKFYASCEPRVAEEHREGMRAARADFLKALD